MEKKEMKFKVAKTGYNAPSAYVYDNESKCLREITIKSAKYNLNTGTSELTWVEADTNKEIVSDLSDVKVYASEEFFKRCESLCVDDIIREIDINELFDLMYIRNIQTSKCGGRKYGWVYADGEAQKWFFDEHIGEVTFNYIDKNTRNVETDVKFPDFYFNAEEVYRFNDYTVVNADGTKTFHEGVCKRLQLTDEQKALTDKLQDVINKCKEAKIEIYFDTCNYELYAINVANIERIEYDPVLSDDEEAHEIYLRNARKFNNIYDINLDDPDYQMVIKKTK